MTRAIINEHFAVELSQHRAGGCEQAARSDIIERRPTIGAMTAQARRTAAHDNCRGQHPSAETANDDHIRDEEWAGIAFAPRVGPKEHGPWPIKRAITRSEGWRAKRRLMCEDHCDELGRGYRAADPHRRKKRDRHNGAHDPGPIAGRASTQCEAVHGVSGSNRICGNERASIDTIRPLAFRLLRGESENY
ncbi:MAG: hypothetical protein JNJ73_19925 [Hyphomonadaceae bacterium]|nr:hypothetical protein [Hyphomonadaceae bacterium]